MTDLTHENLADFSMIDLFKIELDNQTKILEQGLLIIEENQTPESLEPLMRAAHSMKGAARIVDLKIAVTLAHSMEDVLSAGQNGKIKLDSEDIDLLLKSNDFFKEVLELDTNQIENHFKINEEKINSLSQILRNILIKEPKKETKIEEKKIPEVKVKPTNENQEISNKTVDNEPSVSEKIENETVLKSGKEFSKAKEGEDLKNKDSMVRILAKNLERLMGLTGESVVQAKSIKHYSDSLQKIRRLIQELSANIESVTNESRNRELPEKISSQIHLGLKQIDQIHTLLYKHLEGFELFSRHFEHLSDKLYNEVISSKMQPFSDGLHGFSRMVRDLSKNLGKKVHFSIEGESTKVDRDILEKLEAPMTHLLSNAIDHGVETPEERSLAGKDLTATLILRASHSNGMLNISVIDDGRGIDIEKIKEKIVKKGYVSKEMSSNLSKTELIDFLFLPNFSTSEGVTNISGRGFGLDIVTSMLREVRGSVNVETTLGVGTSFHLQLPLTLSVVRTLIVEIVDELYAIPLFRIDKVLEVPQNEIRIIEDHQFCLNNGKNIGIIDAHQILKLGSSKQKSDIFSIVLISDRLNSYGLVVDSFVGEKDLVITNLDHRLGKIPNISAGSTTEDGAPILVLDVDDLVRSIDNLLSHGKLNKVGFDDKSLASRKKRVLVVDDSITVREVERRLLENYGFDVIVSVDGVDGWNILQYEKFDLVVSDVDMPRLNGIEFIRKIKNDQTLNHLPVMIVSYKDREEDKLRGLEAGANYYLTKSSFHDETFIQAVKDLIGEP